MGACCCISREKTQQNEIPFEFEKPLFDFEEENNENNPIQNSPVIFNKIIGEKSEFNQLKKYIFTRLELLFERNTSLQNKYQSKTLESCSKIRHSDRKKTLFGKKYSSKDYQTILLLILVNYFVENDFTPLQKTFLREFDKIKENFFSEWEKIDKSLRDTYEICFYCMFTIFCSKSDHKIDLEYNLIKILFMSDIFKIKEEKPFQKMQLSGTLIKLFKEILFSEASLFIFQKISKSFKRNIETLEETKTNLEYLTDHFLNNTYIEHSMTNIDGLTGIFFPNGICVLSKELFEKETSNICIINILVTSCHLLCHMYKHYFSQENQNFLFESTPRQIEEKIQCTLKDIKCDGDVGKSYEESIFGVNEVALSDKNLADFIIESKPWLNPNSLEKIKLLIHQKNKRVYCLFSFGEFEPMANRSHEEVQKLILAHMEYLRPQKT